ncbi:hypothetical protein EDD37DRAFT_196583 [Exophiala viscosa]|uniref:uncharacterized protein n=1 Tax=Exophiala viscosa TaxID=2486360 RepID=UPI0021939C3C|nr:hypothetical protein EDD37DRAFT_196583 [Exophiala viscosa]
MTNERTPLLGSYAYGDSEEYPSADPHQQFCMLVGVPSSAPELQGKKQPVPKKSLYGRVTRQLGSQRFTYLATASLSSTLLLTQVVLGAALTALGASRSSHILITIFGALNTVIAGLVAYLKSRGQPMRARMYRDDLERVVDEIENSEVMWLGIARHVHGYDEIDTDDRVSVRSEVARLTRLYDRAIRTNTINNPDMYEVAAAGFEGNGTNIKHGVSHPIAPVPVPTPAPPVAVPAPAGEAAPATTPSVPAPAPAPAPVAPDPDESPATAPPQPKAEPKKGEEKVKDNGQDKKEDGDAPTKGDSGEPAKEGESSPDPKNADKSTTDAQSSKLPQPNPKQNDPDSEPASDPQVPLKDRSPDAPNRKA